MFLIELLLPVKGRDGEPINRILFDRLKTRLADRFGEVTALVQAPAEGLWECPTGGKVEDRVAVFQVMADEVDVEWWRSCRQELEHELGQKEIVVRSFYATRI